MIDFEGINRSLNIVRVAEWLGMEVRRGGSCLCPFHPDTHLGNFKLSERLGRFTCFACGERGDAITLTARLKGVTNGEAAAILNSAFALGFPVGRPPTRRERAEERQRRARIDSRRRFDLWADLAFQRITGQMRASERDVIRYRPGRGEESPRFAAAVHRLSLLEGLADLLIERDPAALKYCQQLIEEMCKKDAGHTSNTGSL